MIELTVIKTSENPSVFTLSPSSIEIGGKDSSLIDSIHVNIPPEWQGKVIRATFNQSALYGGNIIPKILNAEGVIELKNDVTLCSGDLVIDAVGVDGSVSPSTGCHYTVYSHPKFGGTEQVVTPSEYQQFVAETKGYSDSAQANATAANASKTAAETAASAAQGSAGAAAQSETNSKASEAAAKTSETNSADSATASATSATAAQSSETNAKASESASANNSISAADSATSANASKEAAALSETNAKASETAAKTSETNSADSATASATSATAADASKTAAALSETNAASSATAAKTSETNSADSATASATSATAAETAASDVQAANIVNQQNWTDAQKLTARTNINAVSPSDLTVGDWITPTLIGSWVQYNSTNYPVGYWKDRNNIVHFRGRLSGGVAGTAAFVLATGYKPKTYLTFSAPNSSVSNCAATDVVPNGNFYPSSLGPYNSFIDISGVTFRAEA